MTTRLQLTFVDLNSLFPNALAATFSSVRVTAPDGCLRYCNLELTIEEDGTWSIKVVDVHESLGIKDGSAVVAHGNVIDLVNQLLPTHRWEITPPGIGRLSKVYADDDDATDIGEDAHAAMTCPNCGANSSCLDYDGFEFDGDCDYVYNSWHCMDCESSSYAYYARVRDYVPLRHSTATATTAPFDDEDDT